jgi:hypothetical protein
VLILRWYTYDTLLGCSRVDAVEGFVVQDVSGGDCAYWGRAY